MMGWDEMAVSNSRRVLMKPVLKTVWRVLTAVCILSISVDRVEAQTGSVNESGGLMAVT